MRVIISFFIAIMCHAALLAVAVMLIQFRGKEDEPIEKLPKLDISFVKESYSKQEDSDAEPISNLPDISPPQEMLTPKVPLKSPLFVENGDISVSAPNVELPQLPQDPPLIDIQPMDMPKDVAAKEIVEKEPTEALSADSVAAPAPNRAQIDKKAIPLAEFLPIYPREAQLRNIEGVVRLRISIDMRGFVSAVEVIKSAGFKKFDKAALDAVRKVKFEPAISKGVPVSSIAEVDIEFKLKK